MAIEGRKFFYSYASGLRVEGEFLPGARVAWKALTGPAAGQSGAESVSLAEVRPGLWFVSWVEASGATVSQTLDLDAMKVRNFVSFDAGGGTRRGMLDAGSLQALG